MSARILVLVSLFISSTIFAQGRIDLTEGTLFLQGSFTFNYELINFNSPDHRMNLKSDVGGGYFIANNLAIGIGIPAKWNISLMSAGNIGLKVFSNYYFDIKNGLFPYIGASVIPTYSMNQRQFQLSAGLDVGVLFSLSESIALNFGVSPEIFFKIYDSQKWQVSVPAGFFGIKAVF